MNKKVLAVLIVSFLVVKCAKCQDITFTSKERDSATTNIKSGVTITVAAGKLTVKYESGFTKTYKVALTSPAINEISFATEDGFHQWNFITERDESETVKQKRQVFGMFRVTEIFTSGARNKNFTEITYYKNKKP